MKNLHKLPNGTKLVWDTVQHLHGEEPRRIYYPCLKTETCRYNPRLGAKIVSPGSSDWMGSENEHLREPTEEELNTLDWTQCKSK